ncbi:MAG: hypothetical protein CVU56_20425 [Deltaproteobacteria bacterium HGW-Deltaproteobacteria-14]|jgi:hypothetical protein|nr:MAG: hypothetical protein CVU56_20425 [Deltaproteobacteria bacterium HGW-Deltaproteobacteria-14]
MAYTPMYEMWRMVVEGAPFDVMLDLGHGEDYPLVTHPWFFGVRIPMTNRNEDGLPSEEEAARLDLVENRVRETLRSRDGVYVGRRTGMGNRDLLIYFPVRPRGLEDRIRASIGMEILFISRADPRWEGYQQLLPGEKDWRSIEDAKLIAGLLNANTDPKAEHHLEHSVETSLNKGAEALVGLMEKLELDDVAVEGERPALIVRGTQRTMLDPEQILRVSWVLEQKAPKARGTYLGWQAEIVPLGDAEGSQSVVESILADLDLDD